MADNRIMKPKMCVICGETFGAPGGMGKYCPDCKKDMPPTMHKRQREEYIRTHARPLQPTLGDTERAAREARMSYGKYVAMTEVLHGKLGI